MFFVSFWPAIVWTGVIFVLVLIPGSDLPDWSWADSLSLDKFIHLGIFYVLIILVLNSLKKINTNKNPTKRQFFYALCYGLSLSAGTELLQDALYIARKADILDFLANSAGCIIAVTLYYKTIRTFEKLKKRLKEI